jgi:hypothetical protein
MTTDFEHETVTPADGFIAPAAGTITGIRTIDANTGTPHSGTAVHFILMNFTTGAHSGDNAMVLGDRQNNFPGLSLSVNRGDILAPLVTEWGAGDDDPTNVSLELQVSIR